MSLINFLPAKGSNLVIVGGCGGMGKSLVNAAIEHGLSVVVLDLPISLKNNPVPDGVIGIECDLKDEQSVIQAFNNISEKWTVIDGLVNLAGYTGEAVPVEKLSTAEWDSITDVGLRGMFLVAREALPLLKKSNNASVVLISSTFGHRVVFSGYAAYASAKAGVVALGKALAIENAPNIRVNVVSPGVFRTPFLDGGTGQAARTGTEGIETDKYHNIVPLGRIGEPEEMAGPILFLLGPAASYITGQVLHVNGGTWAP